jgi:hypothetical protein
MRKMLARIVLAALTCLCVCMNAAPAEASPTSTGGYVCTATYWPQSAAEYYGSTYGYRGYVVLVVSANAACAGAQSTFYLVTEYATGSWYAGFVYTEGELQMVYAQLVQARLLRDYIRVYSDTTMPSQAYQISFGG